MVRNLILVGIMILFTQVLYSQVLKINEVMPSNGITSFDSFNEASDWLEIYNNTNSTIQLSDYYISNNFSNKLKWQLPVKNLSANSMILIYCSGRDIRVSEYHANFKLSNEEDSLGIFFKDGSTIDVMGYDSMPIDVSYGLQPDGTNANLFFQSATPNASNNTSLGYSCLLNEPIISEASGFYSSPLAINISHSIPGVEVRFTENGNTPDPSSNLYAGSVNLTTNVDVNRLSLIPTNPGLTAPVGFYSVARSNNRGYVPPAVDVQNVNVFKARAFKSGCIPSEVVSKTYLLDNGSIVFPTTPIISIQLDSLDLFSNDTGMYVYGKRANGNYLERGAAWERKSQLVYFDNNQNKLIDLKLGIELHGNGSRHSTHKNFRFSAKAEYGESKIEAPLFEGSDIDEFKKLIVRSPGHRPDCMPRDELAASLVSNMGIDFQNYSTSVMYLNGEYWGVNVLKERLDDDYISIKYDMSKDDIVILEGDGILSYGESSDTVHYKDLLDYIDNNDLNDSSNLAYVNTQMDIENYMDYMVAQIHVGNGDWPSNNVRFWRKRAVFDDFQSTGHDGRWRWMYFDIDGGFGGTCSDVYFAINNLDRALDDSPSVAHHTRLFRGLTSYQTVYEMYINRTCDRLNSTFTIGVMNDKLDEIINGLDPLMMDHVNRHGYPSVSSTLAGRLVETPSLDKWNYLVSRFEKFMNRRNFYIRRQMKDEWNLADTFNISIDVNDVNRGYVQLNSLHINSELEGISSSVYPWTGMYFEGIQIPLVAHAFPGFRFKEWAGTVMTEADTSVSISSDTLFTAVFEVDPNYVAPFPITINELQAWNTSTVFDEYIEFDDWIELYNPNNFAVDISGYYLTDNKDKLKKYWIGPNELIIPANSWSVFWADDETGQGQNHTNFKLSKDGEFVALVAPDGITIVDSIQFGAQQEDYSFGRQADGMSPWVEFKDPTPFYSNLSNGVDDNDVIQELVVFPNPVNGETIFFNQNISGEIYSISGILKQTLYNVSSVSISDFSSGVYIIRNANSGESVKLIVP